jgi:hypothetical protein
MVDVRELKDFVSVGRFASVKTRRLNVGKGVEDAVTGYEFGANFRTDGVSYTPDYVEQLAEARTKRQAIFAQPNSTIGNHFTGSGEKLTQP